MKTLSLSEAKMKLSGLVQAVSDTDEEIVITKNGAPAAVLISLGEFESLKETIAVRQARPSAPFPTRDRQESPSWTPWSFSSGPDACGGQARRSRLEP